MIAMTREPNARVRELALRVMDGRLPADEDETLCFAAAWRILERTSEGTLPAPDDRLEAICAAADAQGVSPPAAALHYTLVVHYAERGDAAAARRHADAYLPYAESPIADALDRRYVAHLRGWVALAAGDLEEALLYSEQELQEARDSGTEMNLDVCEANVAEILLDLARPGEALPHAAEGVRQARLPGGIRRFALLQLARAHSQLGDAEAALTIAREIETELLSSGHPLELVQAELDQVRQHVPVLTSAGAVRT